MTWKKRIAIGLTAILSSKQVSAAVASSAVTAAAFMPIVEQAGPWVLGAAGSTIVHAYKPPKTTWIAVAHGVMSVVLGGLGGPVVAAWAAGYAPFMTETKAVLLTSFALAASWPWVAPKLGAGLSRMWDGFVSGFVSRQGGDK